MYKIPGGDGNIQRLYTQLSVLDYFSRSYQISLLKSESKNLDSLVFIYLPLCIISNVISDVQPFSILMWVISFFLRFYYSATMYYIARDFCCWEFLSATAIAVDFWDFDNNGAGWVVLLCTNAIANARFLFDEMAKK